MNYSENKIIFQAAESPPEAEDVHLRRTEVCGDSSLFVALSKFCMEYRLPPEAGRPHCFSTPKLTPLRSLHLINVYLLRFNYAI
jgi:hypothetical protein